MTLIRRLVISSATWALALSDTEPISVTPAKYGARMILEASSLAEWEAWLVRILATATDAADEGEWNITKMLMADYERAQTAKDVFV